MDESKESGILNIIPNQTIILADNSESGMVLFSSLKADAIPVVPYEYTPLSIEYFQGYSGKCAICNSPHRALLEQVYLDSGKVYYRCLTFFREHFNAKLNFVQIKHHLNQHCDFKKIEVAGLDGYRKRTDLTDPWLFREYELALTAMLVELDDLRGHAAKNFEEKCRRATIVQNLTKQITSIKEKRDGSNHALPNVFEVLYQVHEMMVNDEDKRIIREKTKELKNKLS